MENAFNEGYNITNSSASGMLAGPGGINLQGYYLLLTCSNIMTGGNTIGSPLSVLQLGNNTTNGSIGTGVLTNLGTLVLDRSDTNLLLSQVISGNGSISNAGSGNVTLAGANTYTGSTIIRNPAL